MYYLYVYRLPLLTSIVHFWLQFNRNNFYCFFSLDVRCERLRLRTLGGRYISSHSITMVVKAGYVAKQHGG